MFSILIEIPEAYLAAERARLAPQMGIYRAMVCVHEELIDACLSALHAAQKLRGAVPAFRN